MQVKNVYPFQLRNLAVLTADTLMGVGVWVQVGAGYTVPAGRALKLGFGNLSGQDNARGRFYCDMVDVGATAEDGEIRIVAMNPGRTQKIIKFQTSTVAARSATADDRTGQIPFPENPGWIPEDWTVAVEMLADAAVADTIDVSASTLLMDCQMGDLVK